MNNNKIAVLYHHFSGTPGGDKNLDFFIKNGVIPTCDYYFNIVEGSDLTMPQHENCKVHVAENKDMDYGGFQNLIKNHLDIAKYEALIFLNSTVRGPYHKSAANVNDANWAEDFTAPLKGDVHLSGAAISILHPTSPHAKDFHAQHNSEGVIPHVQTMAYAMTGKAVEMLVTAGFYDQQFNNDRNSIIAGYELFLSALLLKSGLNISASLPRYQGIDYRTLTYDFNPTSVNGDALFPGAYFSSTADPFDNIFVKTRRNYVDIASIDFLNAELVV